MLIATVKISTLSGGIGYRLPNLCISVASPACLLTDILACPNRDLITPHISGYLLITALTSFVFQVLNDFRQLIPAITIVTKGVANLARQVTKVNQPIQKHR